MSDKKRGRPFKWGFHMMTVGERQFVEVQDHGKEYSKIYQAARQAGSAISGKFKLSKEDGGFWVVRVS